MPPAHHVPQKEHINAQKIAPIHAMYFLFPVSFSSHSSIHPRRIYNLDVAICSKERKTRDVL
jgi:hypothetical protein